MKRDVINIVPPVRRKTAGLLRLSVRVAMALALAIANFVGPSHVSAEAPESNGSASAAQHHHGDHGDNSDAGHEPPETVGTVYCNALTPNHASHAQNGDDVCESHRVMSSALTATSFDMARYYVLLSAHLTDAHRPLSHSPEGLTEPPRSA